MPTPTQVDLVHLSASLGGSRRLSGHLARPGGTGPWPGVIVVHEALGVDEVMLRQTERLARAGYLTLMPDLFSDGGVRRCLVPTMRAATSGRGRAWVDLEAARQSLAAHPDCTGRIGIIGFCMGGSFALLAAGRGDFDAASVNYGQLPEDSERALAKSCPVVASYGGRDRMLKGAAARLEAALTQVGAPHDVKEYPAAGHSFLNDAENAPRWLRPLTRISGIGPEPVSAADAWRRIEEFFAEHLADA
ncbi:dienelactone hydrolase family protein [Streptomyces caniscabiei]|uniref:dienelactone hydrolase family protein n=1 Tax=Streptomyces caniscabiei TaxID=2746961 RepID=UPI0029B56CEE|nr:dienelactone hydrolase family protein [Streptomyces caniscabiei]MDX2604262.1 dienelactone hydrolase family protein [Streptomyces caniscabiei]MDX2735604.1 dienelactone hydrolase family protein [Streptomyces caniscabiei]MDX2776993.1 dienelactone hydrolase family protein [Streptomyces caniscabiei]